MDTFCEYLIDFFFGLFISFELMLILWIISVINNQRIYLRVKTKKKKTKILNVSI